MNAPLVFLDLEETLVDNWNDGNLLEVGLHRTREFLKELKEVGAPPAVVGLMSWAVWNSDDKVDFDKRFRPFLEAELRVKFDPQFFWSMDDWCTELLKHAKKKLDRADLFDMFGKEEVLMRLARCHPAFRDREVFLVDDRVNHELVCHVPQTGCLVTLLNVNEMRD